LEGLFVRIIDMDIGPRSRDRVVVLTHGYQAGIAAPGRAL